MKIESQESFRFHMQVRQHLLSAAAGRCSPSEGLVAPALRPSPFLRPPSAIIMNNGCLAPNNFPPPFIAGMLEFNGPLSDNGVRHRRC